MDKRRVCWAGGVVAGMLVAGTASSQAQLLTLESTGARGGVSDHYLQGNFYEAQAFANWNLPWGWDLGKNWRLQSRLDLTAGWLGEGGDDAAIGSLGPSLVLSGKHMPFSVDIGLSPTLVSHSIFPAKNLGGPLEFTSHFGLNADVSRHIRLGYRFEHLSNGDLRSPNPGLNVNFLSVSYVF